VVAAIVGLVVAGVIGLSFGLVSGGSDDSDAVTSQSPDGRNCPSDYPVKGNVSQEGERIYHLRGWRYYDATYPDKCFVDAEAAEDAGYRASKVK
jgi:hypothetical protein